MGYQTMGSKECGRNDPCPCKSGLKFKYCHGDELKRAIVNKSANELMLKLIEEEKEKKLCSQTEQELSDVSRQNGQSVNPPEVTPN